MSSHTVSRQTCGKHLSWSRFALVPRKANQFDLFHRHKCLQTGAWSRLSKFLDLSFRIHCGLIASVKAGFLGLLGRQRRREASTCSGCRGRISPHLCTNLVPGKIATTANRLVDARLDLVTEETLEIGASSRSAAESLSRREQEVCGNCPIGMPDVLAYFRGVGSPISDRVRPEVNLSVVEIDAEVIFSQYSKLYIAAMDERQQPDEMSQSPSRLQASKLRCSVRSAKTLAVTSIRSEWRTLKD
jgi:hypothetical protein